MPPKCPSTDEWIKKNVILYIYIYICIHTHTHTTEYYSAIKMNKILPFAKTQMTLEDIMFSEISQTEKDKYCMLLLICEA